MKHEEGVCPKCGSKKTILEYGGKIQSGLRIGYEWKCPVCNAEGVEWYTLNFSEHEIRFEGEKK